MQRNSRAFTLIEMMVVLTISLTLMTMIVPIFKVSTKTVQVVERKLAVYEAARNLLDLIECEVQLAITNESGDRFSIKHVAWKDTDPFTPDPGGPELLPGVTDAANAAYKQSRRVSDALDYVRIEGHGTNTNWVPNMRQFPGGKFFPLSYPVIDAQMPEAWVCSMRSTLLYQTDLEYYQEQDQDASGNRWSHPEQLADVGQVELAFIFEVMGAQWSHGGPADLLDDAVPNKLGPGREIKVPHGWEGYEGIYRQRRLGGVKLMDLDVAFWDDTKKQFVELPDNTVVYFSPMPKAVRTTITVCDPDKHDILTLCRITQLPCGSGDGGVKVDSVDEAYYTDLKQPNNTMLAVYNRTKYLPQLPNAFNGDGTGGWAGDYSTTTENKIITNDGVKPINWP